MAKSDKKIKKLLRKKGLRESSVEEARKIDKKFQKNHRKAKIKDFVNGIQESLKKLNVQLIYVYSTGKDAILRIPHSSPKKYTLPLKKTLTEISDTRRISSLKRRTKGLSEICGKCGISREGRLREWSAIASPGVLKIGSDSGAFMFCENCQKGICGKCSIDLGMTAGCPLCRTELVYMDGRRQ